MRLHTTFRGGVKFPTGGDSAGKIPADTAREPLLRPSRWDSGADGLAAVFLFRKTCADSPDARRVRARIFSRATFVSRNPRRFVGDFSSCMGSFHLSSKKALPKIQNCGEVRSKKERTVFMEKTFTPKTIAKLGMLAALSVVMTFFIHFPLIPGADFLEYDPADIPILIGTFTFGPWAGLALTVVTSTVQGLTVSAKSGIWGIIMHICATGAMALVCGLIYQKGKTMRRAAIALVCGAITMVLLMIPLNMLITPIFMGGTPEAREIVKGMIVPVIIPFNVLKAGINCAVTFVLFRAVGHVLRRF